jgi:hypothetical protein
VAEERDPHHVAGPLPSLLRASAASGSTDGQGFEAAAGAAETAAIFQPGDQPNDDTLPAYMEPIRPLLNASVSKDYFTVLGFGSRIPIYTLPAGFQVRPVPPSVPAFLFSGTHVSNGVRIGLLRVPPMSPPSSLLALGHRPGDRLFQRQH